MKGFVTPRDFKKRLQLATSVSVHSFKFGIHLLDPEFFPHSQEHGVLVPDLLEDRHGHVRHSMIPLRFDFVCLGLQWTSSCDQ